MRWLIPVLSPVLCSFALAADTDDAKTDLKAIQGAWQVVEVATADGLVPADEIKGAKVTIKDNKLTLEGLDKEKKEFTFKLDPSTKPKSVDLISLDGTFKGQTTLGIYALDGDSLKFCLGNQESKVRPKAFKADKESDLLVLSLKRVK
jgi:uncharacterized protein (TIGR03067 family)